MTVAVNQKENLFISEMSAYIASHTFNVPKEVYSATEILDMIKATKVDNTVNDFPIIEGLHKDLTNILRTYAEKVSNQTEKENENVILLINKHNKQLSKFIEECSKRECKPYGIQYITFKSIIEGSADNLKVLVSQHKSRTLRLVDDFVPANYIPKKISLVLKVVTYNHGQQTKIVAIRTTKYEKIFAYLATLAACVVIIGGTVAIMGSIDKTQNAKVATQQIEDIEVLSDDEVIDKWLEDFENCEIDFGRTIHPEYFVSNVEYFNKVIEELVEHTDNIQIEKIKGGYKVDADVRPVSQYSSIINAPLTRPDISNIREELKSGKVAEEDIQKQLDNVQYQLFSDFCFLDVPDVSTVHVDSVLTVENGEVKGSIDFLDKLLDTTGIRNNVTVFDAEIGQYMYNLTTDSGKEAKQN